MKDMCETYASNSGARWLRCQYGNAEDLSPAADGATS
jgi:hypothetical protein